MKGRDLIVFILANNLEDEEFADNEVLNMLSTACMDEMEAAAKFNIGSSTLYAWIQEGILDAIVVGGKIYILKNAEPKKK